MNRAFVNDYCAALPGADHSDPWAGGHHARKVGGKLFAVMGAGDEAVSVKCRDAETAQLLIELGRAERAPYFHRSWARIPLGTRCTVDQDELADRLSTSYGLGKAGRPGKIQSKLD